MGVMVGAVLDGRLDPEELVDETGNVPADALYRGFLMQAPTTEIARHATLLQNLWNDEFVEAWQAMAQWSREQVPFPGAALRQIVADLVRRNVLMTGHMQLNGREVDFSQARGDVLVAVAEKDKVVPLPAAEPAIRLVGDPARRDELRLAGGHVTFFAGRHAFQRTLPALTKWLAAHSNELDPPKER
jgi:polyhydroxyalkanoate synthase